MEPVTVLRLEPHRRLPADESQLVSRTGSCFDRSDVLCSCGAGPMRGGRLDAPPKCLHLRLSWYWSVKVPALSRHFGICTFLFVCTSARNYMSCRVLADAQKIKIDDV